MNVTRHVMFGTLPNPSPLPTCDLCDEAGDIRVHYVRTRFGPLTQCMCETCCADNYPGVKFAALEVL